MSRPVSPLWGAVVVAALLVAATVVGTALLADDTAPRPDPEGVAEQYRSLDGFRATQVQTVTVGGETRRTVRRVALRPGTGQYRSVALEQSDETVYDLIVSNGSVQWLYDRDNRTAWRISVDGAPLTVNGTALERLVTAAVNDTGDGSGAPALPSVSPLGSSAPSAPASGLSTLQWPVEYEGVDRVGGRRAYVISSSPDQPGVESASSRVWLDATYFVPLRRTASFQYDGERYETTLRYRNVSFDPDLEGVSFEFDPPENVTVPTRPRTRSFDTRAALSRATDVELPRPDVPDGFEFEEGSLLVTEDTVASLRYENETARLTVVVTNESGSFDARGSQVTVAGRSAHLDSVGGTSVVSWNCSDHSVQVYGSVSNATVLDVAASIGCDRPTESDRERDVAPGGVRDGDRRRVVAERAVSR